MLPFHDRSRTPTYDLAEVQRLVGQGPISSMISDAARQGAARLDLYEAEIVEAILLLSSSNFHKTMEAERTPGLWQDVYHLRYREKDLYVKVQIDRKGRAIVISCKKR
jgi:Motility quorum-sensing regulator, toxin of MqsA